MTHFKIATAPSAAAYKKVAAEHPPQAIHTEKERRYWMGVLARLMAKPEAELTDAEAVYGQTIALLIEAFERSRASLPKLAPAEVLAELLSAHNLRQKDLVDIFGSEAAVSYAVNGERNLTVEQIKGLAEKFQVSPAVFF
jgi:HTH-type transcriptional regulator/antitoxin HigA